MTHPDLDECRCGHVRVQHHPNDGCFYSYCACWEFEHPLDAVFDQIEQRFGEALRLLGDC